ncbi:MAG: biosynthetic-type acetolactate synthase large subunit [Lachnospiraceae bacterium]|nr:biosynthetic-type acetolactate synthase large subunit [Lachnospiraceae bacterium]
MDSSKYLTGSEIIIEVLKEEGVDTVFGYPGGAILNVYDELYRHSNEIRHILTSHEQGASHAADGYARATGRVGVCMATSGPGSTNLVTGIATAQMDSVPMVAITCNVNLPLLGKDTFQEVDIAGVTMPITKHGYIVKDINILADTLRKAFKIAASGRPGPVIVDITKDVTANKCIFESRERPEIERKNRFDDETLEEMASLINSSEKPFLYVGGGASISGASNEVRELAHKINAPVCDTLMGKGVFDPNDPLYTGMIGMHGTKATNIGVSECDLLIALGARFSDRCVSNAKKFASNAKIIHVDIDDAEINKNIRADLGVVGDLKTVLSKVLPLLSEKQDEDWIKHIQELKAAHPMVYEKDRLTCPAIIEAVDALTGSDAIITTDVGQHQMWTAQFYRFKHERQLLTSGGLGTMGYGLGAAIGAKIGCPEKTVINIGGDGCFRMNMNELATASRYDIHIIDIIIDNRVLGMVRQWQTFFYGKRYSQTVLQDKVDYCKVAEGLGCKAYRLEKMDDLEDCLKKALSEKGPVLIDCIIDPDAAVYPMVPPGGAISDAFDASDIRAE